MGHACSAGASRACSSHDACTHDSCSRPSSMQRFKNTKVSGMGGKLRAAKGRVSCLVVAFDYEGYPAEEKAGCGPLSAVTDGVNFAALARVCEAEVTELYDRDVPKTENSGFPRKSIVIERMKRAAKSLGPDDVFVFFYAGHGTQAKDSTGEEADGLDEMLCFVEPDGSANFLSDDEISALLLRDFDKKTRILFVTDCCHGGTICDLARSGFTGRPICHLSAVKDSQCAADLGDGGAFTCSLLETIEQFNRDGEAEFSIVDVFNACYGKYDEDLESQDFKFELAPHFDPDTFAWPLVPPAGWEVKTALDPQCGIFSTAHREIAKKEVPKDVDYGFVYPHMLRSHHPSDAPADGYMSVSQPVSNALPDSYLAAADKIHRRIEQSNLQAPPVNRRAYR